MTLENKEYADLPLERWELEQEVEADFKPKQLDIGISKMIADIWKTQIYFSSYQATSIILDLDPYEVRNEDKSKHFRALKEVLEQYTTEGYFRFSKLERVKDKDLGDITVFKIHRNDVLAYRNDYLKIPLTLKEVPRFDYADFPPATAGEYEGEIPIKTNAEKLKHFIELLLRGSKFLKGDKLPTYSELHTILSYKYPKEIIPSKNTLRKYLEA